MYWMLADAICLARGLLLLAQAVYKVTDAHSNVTLTDTPPLSGDGTIEEHSGQAPNSPKPTHRGTRIVTPAYNATAPMEPGNFAVQAAWDPPLASGETIQLLLLDGEPVGAPQQTAIWRLSNVYRGVQLDAWAASTFYVLRPSVNK